MARKCAKKPDPFKNSLKYYNGFFYMIATPERIKHTYIILISIKDSINSRVNLSMRARVTKSSP